MVVRDGAKIPGVVAETGPLDGFLFTFFLLYLCCSTQLLRKWAFANFRLLTARSTDDKKIGERRAFLASEMTLTFRNNY